MIRSLNSVCFIIPLVVAGGTLLRQVPAVGAEESPLVQNGVGVPILVPQRETATERHAAEELAHYLHEACGADFPILSEPQSGAGPCLAVGRTALLRASGTELAASALGVDGFVLRRVGPALLICGINDRGTLYGVYEFLQRYAGCAWYLPGEIGEVVPRCPKLRLPDVEGAERPAFAWRGVTMFAQPLGVGTGSGLDLCEWLVRNRINVEYSKTPPSADGQKKRTDIEAFWAARGGLRKRWNTHSWGRLLPSDKFAADHPEWYALYHGKRGGPPKSVKLCTSNPEVIEKIAQDAIVYLRQHPEEELYSISESDGLGWCECPQCAALDDGRLYQTKTLDDASDNERGEFSCPVVTNRMIAFANAVAERVVKEHPRALLYVLAYHADFLPPSGGLSPHPNVMVQVVHNRPQYVCFNHPIAHDCPRNAAFRGGLAEWMRITRHVTIYDYDRHSQMKSLPFIAPRKFVQDLHWLSQQGAAGYLLQGAGAWGIYGINHYTVAQAMWNPAIDPDDLVEGFCRGLYGPAASAMLQFYGRLEQALRDHDCINLEPTRMLTDYLTPDLIEACAKLLGEARAAASSDTQRQRVELAVRCFEYAERYVSADRAQQRWEKSRDVADLQAAVAEFERVGEVLRKQGSSIYLIGRAALVRGNPLPRLKAELDAAAAAQQRQDRLAAARSRKENLCTNPSAEKCIPRDQYPAKYGHDRAEMTAEVPEGWGCYVGGGSCRWGSCSIEAHSGTRSAVLELTDFHKAPHALGSISCALLPGLSSGYRGADAYRPPHAGPYYLSFWYKGTLPKCSVGVQGWTTEAAGPNDRQSVRVAPALLRPSNQWQQYEALFVLDEKVARFVPRLYVHGKQGDKDIALGTLYVDDVVIRPAD